MKSYFLVSYVFSFKNRAEPKLNRELLQIKKLAVQREKKLVPKKGCIRISRSQKVPEIGYETWKMDHKLTSKRQEYRNYETEALHKLKVLVAGEDDYIIGHATCFGELDAANLISGVGLNKEFWFCVKTETPGNFKVFVSSFMRGKKKDEWVTNLVFEGAIDPKNCWVYNGDHSIWHTKGSAVYRNNDLIFTKPKKITLRQPTGIVFNQYFTQIYYGKQCCIQYKDAKKMLLLESSNVEASPKEGELSLFQILWLDKSRDVLVKVNEAKGCVDVWLTDRSNLSSKSIQFNFGQPANAIGMKEGETDFVDILWKHHE